MIPLRDIVPSRTFPFVTITIIVLNSLAWIFELSLPDDVLPAFLRTYGVVPAALGGPPIVTAVVPYNSGWPTVVTSMFLHGSWMHVIGNMLYLWIFGDNVEDRLGHVRFVVFYLLCGTVAALGQVYANPYSQLPTIGASGAIAGVMGAYFILYPRSRVLALVTLIIFWEIVEVPAVLFLGVWFLMQLFSAGSIAVTSSTGGGGVAFWAHIAGFLAGVGGVFVFRKPERTWNHY